MSPEGSVAQFSVDVVICAYTLDRWDDLVRSVTSASSQLVGPEQLFLIIDHNDQLHERAIPELQAGPVRVLRNTEAQGLSGARNTGLRAARGDAVAFLDDDARAEPGWLHYFRSELSKPGVAGVGGRVVPDWKSGRPGWFPEEFDWIVGCTYRGVPQANVAIRNPIGASMAFRSDALRDAGGFDSGLGRIGTRPVGCEETELSIRVRRAHGPQSIMYVPQSVANHSVPASRATVGYFLRRGWGEGRSKAVVAARTGPDDALESEWVYVTRTLPRAVLRNGLRPPVGWTRVVMIAMGLLTTSLGYLTGRFKGSHDVAQAE